MVSIHSRYAVIPSEPTPNGKLYSLCEQIKLRTHAPLLYVYNKPHNAAPPISVQILINSLSKALVIYYPLAGRLGWIHEGDRWELHCNAKGALLLEATCEEPESLNDLGDFVPTNLVSQLIPNVDVEYDVVPIEEMPLLAVQLTRFRCGGFTLGIALCRAAIDGTAAMRFVSTWAKLARGEGRLDTITEIPCHDRTALDSRKAQQHYSHHRHCEFHAPPIWLGDTEAVTEVVVSTMKLTLEQIKKLKNAANARVRYSTFEVVAGHVWRCVSKARYYGNGEQQTRLSTLVNCRNRLKPPLPNGYAGNAAFPTVTSTCTFGELMQKPLGYAVENVRRALERVNGEFVGSALGYVDREKDMDLVRYNFHYPAKSVLGRGMYKGNPNLFVVSWMNFSFRDADFGWGEPVYFGPGYMDSEGKAFVMNNVNGDGVVVAICLEASHMDRFRKLFYDDITEEGFRTSSKL